MQKKNKNIKIQIKTIKNALNQNIDNTLSLIYRNRKNLLSIKNQFDILIEAQNKIFRKKYTNEKQTTYDIRKQRFDLKKSRLNNIHFSTISLELSRELKPRLDKSVNYSY
jgi:hypothetical protein